MPSFALRLDCWRLRTCAERRVEMARPAASSDARGDALARRQVFEVPHEGTRRLAEVALRGKRRDVGVSTKTACSDLSVVGSPPFFAAVVVASCE
jgi:hypothetical protein